MTTTTHQLPPRRFYPPAHVILLPAFALMTAFAVIGCDDKEGDSPAAATESGASTTEKGATPAPDTPAATTTTKATAKPIAVTADNFEEVVLESDKVVLVDYWATWCGPCKMIAPSVDKIAAEYADRVVVAKLDVDVAGPTAEKYGVKVLPTLMVFKGGKVVDTVPQNRLPSQEDIAQVLEKHL